MKRKRQSELKKRLFEVGITQRDLARNVGLPENKLSMIISGAYIPDAEQMKRISEFLGLPAEDLFQESK